MTITIRSTESAYLNFFPGDTRDERSLSIDETDGYAVEDLEGFVNSVIIGCTSSLYIAADGEDGDLSSLLNALEDGALLADWFGGSEDETEEQRAQREAVEEVHDALVSFRDQQGTATIIQIAYEEPAEAVARVQALLEEVALRDPNWNGAVFRVERDDYTCIPGRDDYDACRLMADIRRALRNEVE